MEFVELVEVWLSWCGSRGVDTIAIVGRVVQNIENSISSVYGISRLDELVINRMTT